MNVVSYDTRTLIRAGLAISVVALLAVMVLAQSGVLPGSDTVGEWADLQRRFGMGSWTSYAVSWLVMAALTAGPYGFYGALIASGVGVAVAIALAAVYWTIRSWTRKQVQAY